MKSLNLFGLSIFTLCLLLFNSCSQDELEEEINVANFEITGFQGSQNDDGGPPAITYWVGPSLVEYASGTSESRKHEIRLSYASGVYYIDSCPFDNNKETWYMLRKDPDNPRVRSEAYSLDLLIPTEPFWEDLPDPDVDFLQRDSDCNGSI